MKQKKSFLITLLSAVTVIFMMGSCTTASFPYTEDFSAGNGNFNVNSNQTNRWIYGATVGNPPGAIYISSNGNTNTYNMSNTSVAHTYRDISIPSGTSITILSFDWRALGENAQDYLRVWLAPTSYTPSPGTAITVGSGRIKVGNDFNLQSTWQTYTNANLDLSSFAGSNMRLIFEWSNNNSAGGQPPAAIDNISLGNCFIPTPMPVSSITPNTAVLNWAAPVQVPSNGYDYYLNTTNVPPGPATISTGNTPVATVNLSSLLSNTTYYWWVRSACSPGKSLWAAGASFTTPACNIITPQITFNNIMGNSASISWPQNGSVLSYQIRYRPVGTLNWTVSNQLPSSPTNTFTLTNLVFSTLYEVEVAGVCDGITGTYSHDEFIIRCDPAPPHVTISNITSNSALITWAPLTGNSIYLMRWREVGTTTWNPVTLPAPPVNTFNLTGLDINKTYEVQVASQCIGNSTPNSYSASGVFTTERTCELPPSGLMITQLTPTTAEVVWDGFPGATYILRYRKVGIPSWTNVSTIQPAAILTGLLELTKYEMQVVNVCSGNIPGNYSLPYAFTTPTVVYCEMASESSAGEYISKVTVTPNGKSAMTNESGASAYTDYTKVPAAFIEFIQGSVGNEISIEIGRGANHHDGVAVWIDFNRNGEFDIDERVFISSPNTTTPVTGRFNVPADAFVSTSDHKYVVMRVAMERDGIPVNCVNVKNGEVEDYAVRISKKPVPNPLDQNDILIYPNPVHKILHIKNISDKANYKLYNISGQFVSEGTVLNNQIDVEKLINSVYILYIDDNGKIIRGKFIKE